MNYSIIGSGNMAWHICHVLSGKGLRPIQIINRSELKGKGLAAEFGTEFTTRFNEIKPVEFLILAINDSALADVVEKIPGQGGIVLHTSGSIPMDVLKKASSKTGVLYPFQTLTYGIETDLTNVPVCIEANSTETLTRIKALAGLISGVILEIDSNKREKLHLAGVVTNNFTNYMISLAQDFLVENNLEPALLQPLILETAGKLNVLGARDAQTGPARRKNIGIIKRHLSLLEGSPMLKNLYSLISDSIIAYYSNTLNE